MALLPFNDPKHIPTNVRGASSQLGASRQRVYQRLGVALIGFTPISALALSLLEVVPLHIGGPVFLSVAMAAATRMAIVNADYRRPVLKGLGAGIVAVLIYDCTRLPFAIWGGWPDFTPRIGAWLLDKPDAHWTVGYLWRYLGNGGGMGVAFAMIAPVVGPKVGIRRAGLLYGTLIWSGLLTTVLLAPDGQEKTFQVTPATLVLSLTGHLVYGGVLGMFFTRSEPNGHRA